MMHRRVKIFPHLPPKYWYAPGASKIEGCHDNLPQLDGAGNNHALALVIGVSKEREKLRARLFRWN